MADGSHADPGMRWSDEQSQALQVLADVYLEQGQTGRARRLLAALAVLAPADPDVLKALSYACLRDERPAEALEAADRLLRLGAPMPANAPLLLLRARALEMLGRLTEARSSLRRYLELTTPDRAALLTLEVP